MEVVKNIENEFENVKEVENNQKSFLSGGLGLAKTYWLFGFIGTFIVNIIITSTTPSVTPIGVIMILGLCYLIPIWIAIWNSAKRYTGLKLWSILAKTTVVLSIIGNFGKLAQS